MSGHPCNFRTDLSGCYPTIQDMHLAMRTALAVRQGKALGTIDTAMDELVFRMGQLSADVGTDLAQVVETEALAADLAALVQRHWPATGSVS